MGTSPARVTRRKKKTEEEEKTKKKIITETLGVFNYYPTVCVYAYKGGYERYTNDYDGDHSRFRRPTYLSGVFCVYIKLIYRIISAGKIF